MNENEPLTWTIWRIHYTSPENILSLEKMAFVFRDKEWWEEKFDTGFPHRSEALLMAARLQILYGGRYAFTVKPNTYEPPCFDIGDLHNKKHILEFIQKTLKPEVGLIDECIYKEDEDEYVYIEEDIDEDEDELYISEDENDLDE